MLWLYYFFLTNCKKILYCFRESNLKFGKMDDSGARRLPLAISLKIHSSLLELNASGSYHLSMHSRGSLEFSTQIFKLSTCTEHALSFYRSCMPALQSPFQLKDAEKKQDFPPTVSLCSSRKQPFFFLFIKETNRRKNHTHIPDHGIKNSHHVLSTRGMN